MGEKKISVSSKTLLKWYDNFGRDLPWRVKGGQKADPYKVWLSEIMLQQTTVKAVIPYFEIFLKKWPTVEALANAVLDDVLTKWAGLGYYARARNLKKCAEYVSNNLGGNFPKSEAGLLTLPGVGPYTAAAITAISYGKKAVVVDGNIERVMSRLFRVKTLLPKAKTILKEKAGLLTPDDRVGDYAQALMDLGATICTPKSPKCTLCPWGDWCLSFRKHDVASFPKREKKKLKPLRYGQAFVLIYKDEIFLQKRPEKGLLGGMVEVPSSVWGKKEVVGHNDAAPINIKWNKLRGVVKHTFTHFNLELEVCVGNIEGFKPNLEKGFWVPFQKITEYALPTLMKKVVNYSGVLPE